MEIRRLWGMVRVVIPVISGVTGSVTK
jgi:hypothetical protein